MRRKDVLTFLRTEITATEPAQYIRGIHGPIPWLVDKVRKTIPKSSVAPRDVVDKWVLNSRNDTCAVSFLLHANG